MSASRPDSAGNQNSTHTIHLAFLLSAVVMALVERRTTHTHPAHFHEPAREQPVSTPLKAQD
jgi:hypothetical protein